MARRRGDLRVTHYDQRLGDNQPDGAVLAGLRNIPVLQRRMVAHNIRRIAVRNLPGDLTLVEIDSREQSVWRLQDGEALHLQGSGAASTTRCRSRSCWGLGRGRRAPSWLSWKVCGAAESRSFTDPKRLSCPARDVLD